MSRKAFSANGINDLWTERYVAQALIATGLSLAVAESLTGGLRSARFAKLDRANEFFRGGVIAYHPEVKFEFLEVTPGPCSHSTNRR